MDIVCKSIESTWIKIVKIKQNVLFNVVHFLFVDLIYKIVSTFHI